MSQVLVRGVTCNRRIREKTIIAPSGNICYDEDNLPLAELDR